MDYYGRPAIKKPTWLWYVPTYFFVGGMASGAYIVATLLDIRARPEDRAAVRYGHAIALAGLLVCPVLLIADLGRPERFINMLRVFKPRSIMNMGTWALLGFGSFSALAAVVHVLEDFGHRLPALRVLGWLGLFPAMFVGTYTGVLLSATNVPLWAGNRLLLGPLFFSSALSSGLAAVRLVLALRGPAHQGTQARLHRAESTTMLAELALQIGTFLVLRGLARPLVAGRGATFRLFGSVGLGTLAPLALNRVARHHRWAEIVSCVLALAGSVMLRFGMTEAGERSADDPRAYFAYTAREGR